MMKVISSQGYLNYGIVDQKIEELQGKKKIVLPIIDAEMKDADGNDLFILIDGHHRKAAAEELGLPIEYEEVENQHGCTGEELLNCCWGDQDWYYVSTGYLVW